jgi:hypothetical protein
MSYIEPLPTWTVGDRVRDQYDGTHLGTVVSIASDGPRYVNVRWDDPGWVDDLDNTSEEWAGDISPESSTWRAGRSAVREG